MTDRELLEWAREHGWKYFSMNRQLMNPRGAMVTVEDWDNLPDHVRREIKEAKERSFAASSRTSQEGK